MQVRNEDNFGKQEYSPADDLFSGQDQQGLCGNWNFEISYLEEREVSIESTAEMEKYLQPSGLSFSFQTRFLGRGRSIAFGNSAENISIAFPQD
jgi:hypothetical protein